MSLTDPLYEKLEILAKSDLSEFRRFFRQCRKVFPEQATEAWLSYVALHGNDAAAQAMNFWLLGDNLYVAVLLDPQALALETAAKAIPVVKEIDAQFLFKFSQAVRDLRTSSSIERALRLLPAIRDYSIFIPWLKRLTQHNDERVRSRSAKLLCELRPNKGVVERQMASDDPRVRSSAIEALWHSKTGEAKSIFLAALQDSDHRVVGNALVGLCFLGDGDAWDRLAALAGHPDPSFRAAAAWAIGHVKDVRGIAVLRQLINDPTDSVRRRASKSLLALEPYELKEPAAESECGDSDPEPPQPPQELPSGPTVNFYLS